MNHGFAQVPCQKCGTIVWISPQVGFGVCPQCHNQQAMGAAGGAQPTQPSGSPMGGYGAPQGQPGMGQPGMGQPGMGQPGMGQPGGYGPGPATAVPQFAPPGAMPMANMGGGFPVFKIIGGVVVALLVAGGGIGFKMFKGKFVGEKGKAPYATLKLDADALDGDDMRTSVEGLATKWKKDAHWWSLNYQAVSSDGTVDPSKGAEVQYISPKGVSQKSKKAREDSVKKFKFGPSVVDYSDQWDATNEWKGVEEPVEPDCTIKKLAKKLGEEGLKGDKTVRITFDPKWDWKNEQLWHVIGDDPKIDARYSMKTCEKVTDDGKAGGHGEGE